MEVSAAYHQRLPAGLDRNLLRQPRRSRRRHAQPRSVARVARRPPPVRPACLGPGCLAALENLHPFEARRPRASEMKWGSCAQLRSAELAFRRLWPFRQSERYARLRRVLLCSTSRRTSSVRTTDTNGLCAPYVTAHNGHERPVRVLRYCAQRTRTACAHPTLLRTTDTNGLCASYVTAHNGHERPVRVLRLLRTTDTNGLCASYVTAHNGHERPVRVLRYCVRRTRTACAHPRYCAQRTRTACARPTLLRTTDTNGLCAPGR